MKSLVNNSIDPTFLREKLRRLSDVDLANIQSFIATEINNPQSEFPAKALTRVLLEVEKAIRFRNIKMDTRREAALALSREVVFAVDENMLQQCLAHPNFAFNLYLQDILVMRDYLLGKASLSEAEEALLKKLELAAQSLNRRNTKRWEAKA